VSPEISGGILPGISEKLRHFSHFRLGYIPIKKLLTFYTLFY